MRNQAALSHLGGHHAPDHLPQVAVTFFEIGILIVHEDCEGVCITAVHPCTDNHSRFLGECGEQEHDSGCRGAVYLRSLFKLSACGRAADKAQPADELNGAEVFVLGEHVDYFNQLGWTDRFSSAAFSARQNGYARRFHLPSAYTPQIVIDGSFEALGSDPVDVERKIGIAAHTEKAVSVVLSWAAQNGLHVRVADVSGEPSAVLLAVTEDGLTTSVGKGENSGRVLRHSGVVRELRQLGTTSGGGFIGTAPIVPAQNWKTRNLRIVVFVQRPGSREIVGAAAVMFP
jgi:hypothetical protein